MKKLRLSSTPTLSICVMRTWKLLWWDSQDVQINIHVLMLASIKDLRLDVATQLRWLELGIHPDGEVQGWGVKEDEIVWVEEGAFRWDEDWMNYVPVEV
ncbi:hypothetical protein [Alicyclobacillus ferrooxydans]|uniref:Uncharacterized protein n=1 Tax=Alicyclobacillus ferrooxydans TaxID=471514 RepID=A0A0P9CC60_9BACL|nr:hypothetical protein [Alicyclobacillus ferrooxydans]KPV43155.1 hypothetical protein AN477_13770 [Alicyclobacillus ferrooxydans]